MIIYREIHPEERPLLDDFLYEAIFIPEGVPAPPRSIIGQEDLQVYVRDFGEAPDDHCLVAECDGKVVGAVWVRVMDDYGSIDKQTPSLAISLYKEYRNRGIGTQLMLRMLDLLRDKGYRQVSLSVQSEGLSAGVPLGPEGQLRPQNVPESRFRDRGRPGRGNPDGLPIDGLLILQPFDGNADVDGKMFHLAHGGVADVTALEINREACEI